MSDIKRRLRELEKKAGAIGKEEHGPVIAIIWDDETVEVGGEKMPMDEYRQRYGEADLEIVLTWGDEGNEQ